MLLQPSADQPMAFVLSVPAHSREREMRSCCRWPSSCKDCATAQGTNTVIGPLPHVTLRQSGAFSEHFELLRQEHRVRCKHVAHTGILWATTESSTTSRPQGQAKNTSAHRNTHGHSVTGTYIECFEHVEKEESVLRMPQMPTPAQQWVTKKAHGGFLVRPPTQEEARQGVAQHAPAKERDAPSPPSSEALCWTGSRNPRKAFGQGRQTRGPKDSATNQWLFSLLKDRKACRQTLCSKEGNRSANTGSARRKQADRVLPT